MNLENLKIVPPEGMEWYQEGNEIKFRPIKKIISYEDVASKLFFGKKTYFLTNQGNIRRIDMNSQYRDLNNCTSEKQARKLLAINQLMNVAKYLNEDWQPDWNNIDESKYFIVIDIQNIITVSINGRSIMSFVYFKSRELAKQAIEILGEETIRLALCTDW